jgi:dethiobiotin synthetase
VQKQVFVAGIGTDVGKTLVAARLAVLLDAPYWKPVQAGTPTDQDWVQEASKGQVKIWQPSLSLKKACSPHEAAAEEGISISAKELAKVHLPDSIVVEGAGGLLVPINDTETMADLAAALAIPIVLVVRYYLGCINHTLLTLAVAEARGLPIAGLVFNGTENPYSKKAILDRYNLPVLLEVPELQPTELSAWLLSKEQ